MLAPVQSRKLNPVRHTTFVAILAYHIAAQDNPESEGGNYGLAEAVMWDWLTKGDNDRYAWAIDQACVALNISRIWPYLQGADKY